MSVDSLDIVAEARKLIGTPYLHQGRLPGASGGLDCVGVPIVVAKNLGLIDVNFDDDQFRVYARDPGDRLIDKIQQFCQSFDSSFPLFPVGSLVVFKGVQAGYRRHCGIVACDSQKNLTLIHACSTYNGVTEHAFVEWWVQRAQDQFENGTKRTSSFAFPGVKYDL